MRNVPGCSVPTLLTVVDKPAPSAKVTPSPAKNLSLADKLLAQLLLTCTSQFDPFVAEPFQVRSAAAPIPVMLSVISPVDGESTNPLPGLTRCANPTFRFDRLPCALFAG